MDQRACKFINVNLDRRPRPGLDFVCDLCMDGNVCDEQIAGQIGFCKNIISC